MITAEEYINENLITYETDSHVGKLVDKGNCIEAMRRFAKLHVKLAMKAVSENVKYRDKGCDNGDG